MLAGLLELETVGDARAELGAGSFARLSVLPRSLELSPFCAHVANPVGRSTFAETGGGGAAFFIGARELYASEPEEISSHEVCEEGCEVRESLPDGLLLDAGLVGRLGEARTEFICSCF